MNGDSGFWKVTFGNVLNICVMIAGLLVFFLSYDHQIRDNTAGLAAQIKSSDAALLVVNSRLQSLEEARAKLERIDETLNWIKDWMKEQKEANRPRAITGTQGK
jgi:hypothetical protein